MSFYILAGISFWGLALWSLHKRADSRYSDLAALAAFIMIAGLRYQTGYDWLVYENYFHAVEDSNYCYFGPPMEPLFWGLNVLVSLLGGDIQTLFFVVASFNGMILYIFCRRFAAPFACVAAICFCWIYLPLHMAALRQSIAVSLFLLAILTAHSRQFTKAAASAVAAVSFQVTAVLYSPILWQRPWLWVWKRMVYVVALCFLCAFVIKSPAQAILTMIAQADITYLSGKVDDYLLQVACYSWRKSEIAYFIFNGALLLLLRKETIKDPVNCLLLSPLLFTFAAQTVFHDFPVLWSRLQMLAIPCGAVFFARLISNRMLPTAYRNMLLIACICFSALVLGYRLDRPLMQPYFPYQNILSSYFKQYSEDDGRLRTEEMYKTFGENNKKIQEVTGCHIVMPLEVGSIYNPSTCKALTPDAVWKQWHEKFNSPVTQSQ